MPDGSSGNPASGQSLNAAPPPGESLNHSLAINFSSYGVFYGRF